MTIVAIHHTKQDILALADGLISRSSARVLEEDQKILIFRPMYRIPCISMGRFNGFSEYATGEFCIAYAGTYSLAMTIIKRFLDIVTQRMALDRTDQGKPMIYERPDQRSHFRSGYYSDDFNFESDELPPITVNMLMNILQRVCNQACLDFHRNAMCKPDVHFVVFGQDRVNHTEHNRVQVIECMDIIHGKLDYLRFSALPWALTLIGDPAVLPSLRKSIETHSLYINLPEPTLLDIDSEFAELVPWMTKEAAAEAHCANREWVVKKETLNLIHSGTNSIGGNCTHAFSHWAQPLNVKTIRYADIPRALQTLGERGETSP